MVRVIPIIKTTNADMDLFLKAHAGLVQRRTWVKDSTGRHGHYRMQWVAPDKNKAVPSRGQLGLFDESPKKPKAAKMKAADEKRTFEKPKKAPMPEWEEYIGSINKNPGEPITAADVSRYSTEAFNLCYSWWNDGPWSEEETITALGEGLIKIGFRGDAAKAARWTFDRIFLPQNSMSAEVAEKSVKDVKRMILDSDAKTSGLVLSGLGKRREVWELYERLGSERTYKYGDPRNDIVVLTIDGKQYVVNGYIGDMKMPGDVFLITPGMGGKSVRYPIDLEGKIEKVEVRKQAEYPHTVEGGMLNPRKGASGGLRKSILQSFRDGLVKAFLVR